MKTLALLTGLALNCSASERVFKPVTGARAYDLDQKLSAAEDKYRNLFAKATDQGYLFPPVPAFKNKREALEFYTQQVKYIGENFLTEDKHINPDAVGDVSDQQLEEMRKKIRDFGGHISLHSGDGDPSPLGLAVFDTPMKRRRHLQQLQSTYSDLKTKYKY
jgi:hypothetical protein